MLSDTLVYIKVLRYICSMEKNNATADAAQGAGSAEFTPAVVEGLLKKDLGIAMTCLDAILSDPDLLQYMAVFMHGRMLNFHQSKTVQEEQLG